MGLAEQIEMRLREAFAPELLEVRNDSARHAGHAGDDGTGERHWHVTVVSAGVVGQSRIARHRAVHAALGADIMGRIHALGLDLREV